MQFESGETEIQKFHKRPTTVGRFPWHDHQIRRLNRAMGQIEECRRAGPADFPSRFATADAVMLEKRRGFHTGDGPIGTVLTIATAAELREIFLSEKTASAHQPRLNNLRDRADRAS